MLSVALFLHVLNVCAEHYNTKCHFVEHFMLSIVMASGAFFSVTLSVIILL
jgi:hypothetical protein